ncbi:MAG: biopolymer transport protein ExbD [Planctomycetota bacterium]|jgi:biopolymer transport protein ExbD
MKIRVNDPKDGDLINLTPLIDIVFLLLIFFMVTASFKEDERDLKVILPGAENADPIKNLPEIILVSVHKDGAFFVGGKSLDKEELQTLFERAKEKNTRQKVMIRADRDVPMQHPVVVLDLCAGLGIATSLATTEGSTSEGGD